MLYAFCFMDAGILLMQLISDLLLRFFVDDETVIALGCTALRIISLSFIFAGFCIVIGSVLHWFGESPAGFSRHALHKAARRAKFVKIAGFLPAGKIEYPFSAMPDRKKASVNLPNSPGFLYYPKYCC